VFAAERLLLLRSASHVQEIRQRVKLKADPARSTSCADSRKHTAFTGRRANISTKFGGTFSTSDSNVAGINVDVVLAQRIVQAWRHRRLPERIFLIATVTSG
jgi:hypothetical protein